MVRVRSVKSKDVHKTVLNFILNSTTVSGFGWINMIHRLFIFRFFRNNYFLSSYMTVFHETRVLLFENMEG